MWGIKEVMIHTENSTDILAKTSSDKSQIQASDIPWTNGQLASYSNHRLANFFFIKNTN